MWNKKYLVLYFHRSEHERHSSSCPFVKGEHTQNVPLSVTYATEPAKPHGEKNSKVC